MLEFSYRPKVFYGFRRDEGRSDETLIERDRVVDVLVLLNSDLRKQQSWGDMKKKTYTRNETKSIPVRVNAIFGK